MSQWGVYFHEEGDCHIAPSLPDGRFPIRHSLHEFCPCGPRATKVYGRTIWIHQDDERAVCRHEHGSGMMDTHGSGEFTCHECGYVQKIGRGLPGNS